MTKINFGEVDTSGGYSVYEKGPYTLRIKSIEEVQAASGNPQLRVKTTFIGGDYDGKQYTDHITLVDSCAWKLAKFLEGCGVDLKALGTVDTSSGQFRQVLNRLINKTTCWVLGVEKDRNGNDRNIVQDWKIDPNAKPIDLSEDTPDFLKETSTTSDATSETIQWDDDESK